MDDGLERFVLPELLDQLGDAVTVIDAGWRYRYVSPRAAEIIGRPAVEVVGEHVWEVFAEVVGTPQHAACVRAMEQRTRERVESFFPTVGRWLQQDALPVPGGLVIVVSDITEQLLAGQRSAQLVAVGEALARASSFDQVDAALVDTAFPLIGASGGVVLLADDERGVLRAVRWSGVDEEVQRAFAEVPLALSTPGTRAYLTGASVFVADLAEVVRDYPGISDALQRVGRHTVAALPLTSGDTRLGALVVIFATARQLSDGDRQFLETVAAMAAQALLRARLLDAERRSIAALQRSLLPQDVPAVPGLEVAVRYQASEVDADVGGDWYDVIALEGGAVGLVMGDVEGHDLGAAALMGLVRSAVRAYALEGHPPAVVLAHANAFLAGLDLGRLVTVSYAHLHPLERLITTVSAGHPGVQACGSDGQVVDLPADVGPPLGVFPDGLRWPETTSTLPARCTLATFTDGLVERRGRDIDAGIERVREVLRQRCQASPDEVADALLASQHDGSHDDVAVLVGRLTAEESTSRSLSRRLPPTPASVFLARRSSRQVLTAWGVDPATVATAELVLSELVTNAARHGEGPVEVRLALDEQVLRVEVGDDSHRTPPDVVEDVDDESTSGRGLLLVQELAARWGVDSEGLSKRVWAELDLPPGQPGAVR